MAHLLHHDRVVPLKGDVHIHVRLHGADLVGCQEALPSTALPAVLQDVYPAPGGGQPSSRWTAHGWPCRPVDPPWLPNPADRIQSQGKQASKQASKQLDTQGWGARCLLP